MKKFFTFFSAFLLSLNVFAQVPQKMSYQAVIRNNSNSLVISSAVSMRISIIQATITGTPVYVEIQTTITNANGLVSIEIGSGTALTGTFAGIDWSAGPYFIKTETDPVGGTNYSITGTSQLLSVPYALYASTASKIASQKNINGVSFDGSADITVSAASNTLTGTTLASNVVNSSLTSVGTITSGTWNGGTIGSNVGGAGNVNGILKANGSGIVNSALSGTDYLSPTGSAALLTNFPILNQSTTGNAATATKLLSTKNINGVAFDGSADITVAMDSNTLTGTTLASNVVNSSLTSVGTITSGTWNGATIAVANGGTGTTNGSITGSTGLSFTAGGTNQNVSLNPSGSGKVVLNGNVGIGTSSPNTSAALDVSSTSQMFYPPRMTTAQRDLISSPSTGGVIYNTTLNKLQVYTASSLNTDGTGYYSNSAVYDDPFQGQTIQPLYSGPLSSIKANVSIRGASDYIQVKIYDAPNGNLLATSDTTFYAPLGAGTFNFVTGTWTFTNSNLIFNANSTYYIEFNAIGGNRFFIGETNNTYSRGQLYKGSSHAGVTAFSSYDIDCAVSYGNPGAWDANVTATKLDTSRNINGVAFDGSSDITIAAASNTLTGTTLAPNVVNSSLTSVGTLSNLTVTNPIAGSVTGNAATATALASGRTIGMTGDLNYTSPSFDGTGNITAIATLANSGVISGTYGSSTAIPSLTIDSKGRITNATTTSIIAGVNTVNSIAGTSNAAGATISGTTITLTPADGINGGVLTNGTQTIAGAKTFTGSGVFSSTLSAGASTLASASITGNETIGGTLAVTGATTLSNLSVSGTSTLTGSVAIGNLGAYVSGDNLVLADANGNLHKRSITPVNTQASATTYTLTLGDNGGILTFASSSSITVTVPSTLPAGFVCQIIQKGTGQITVTGSGTTLNSANGAKSRAQYSAIGVILETSTQGYITGDTTN